MVYIDSIPSQLEEQDLLVSTGAKSQKVKSWY